MRRRVPVVGAVVLALALTAGCVPQGPTGTVPVRGASSLSWEQIQAWFRAEKPGKPCLTGGTTIGQLASYFVWEGNVEGIRGDIAFAQSIVETGWFRYGGQVKCRQNNYAGIGAVDGGGGGASFVSPLIGVRAQIQHLRAYADPFVTKAKLANPCVDPRFDLVTPKGKAPTWNQMGNGNWATSSTYSATVLSVYNRMRRFNGLPSV